MCSTAAHMVDVAVEQVRMGGGVGKLGRFSAGDTPSPAHLRVLLEAEAGVLQNRVAKDLGEGEQSIQTWAGSRRAIKAPISAGCLCKCHGSMGASQAAAGGPRSSGMMPWWPLRSLAHAARPGVVLGSTEGGHWLHVRARRSNKGSPSVDFVGVPDDVDGVYRLDGHLFALPHEQHIVQW